MVKEFILFLNEFVQKYSHGSQEKLHFWTSFLKKNTISKGLGTGLIDLLIEKMLTSEW